MKISIKKLTQIINEEIQLSLKEQTRPRETSRVDYLSKQIDKVEKDVREIYDTIDAIKNILMSLHGDQLFNKNFADRDKEKKTA